MQSIYNGRQEVILDSISDGVFTVDLDWHITSFNKAAERITGVPRDQAIGQRCSEVFRASICENACVLRQTLYTGLPIINKAVYILNSEGERVPISISTAILRDADSHVIGGVETFRDLSDIEQLRKELHSKYSLSDIIGRSAPMQKLFEILPTIAGSESTVLIEGASGTGKELFARAIHDLSLRRSGPFVAVSCGALPDNLLESELFGYKAGAFTDARHDKPGRFQMAQGGTLFLDEIGEVSPAMQIRLLRVLQERIYEPLGSVKSSTADVRVIAATNKKLDELVAAGTFRLDLFYRINIVSLHLPQLCHRREDIPLLIDYFIGKFNRLQDRNIQGLSDDAMACLMSYGYPGNVRELENIIERAYVLCRTSIIGLEHLPVELQRMTTHEPSSELVTGQMVMRQIESQMIQEALHRHVGNRTAAAHALGIHPSTLFRKVKALGITLPSRDGRFRR